MLGPAHPNTLLSMNNLAGTYAAQGDKPAQALFMQCLDVERRVLRSDHPRTLITLADVASMYQRESMYALAESYAAKALAAQRHAVGSENQDAMASAADLALAYQSQGKFVEAEPLAREALEFNRKKQPVCLARIPGREPAGRQPGWTEEICRSGTAAV